ncbi:MAG: AAA family ATPase [Deltaproteobacteria bacterium]|nr:AAA family ATPase [Deltaproteobacteria bacterium]
MITFNKDEELNRLTELFDSKKSEFLYVRGRRRVGKSWLLDDFVKRYPAKCFFFTGKADSRTSNTLSEFVKKWSRFSKDNELLRYNMRLLHWADVFRIIGEYAVKKKKRSIVVFDEIQWIASEGSGFLGALKEAWVTWQKQGWIGVVICGSSNKFFKNKTGGQEKILRGLQTLDHLWVQPITPAEIKSCFLKKWSLQEVCLLYMMIGGIPYYLERLDPTRGFIHAINDALFTQSHNLLAEPAELLSLDFNRAGQKTAEHIMSVLGQGGSDQLNIVKKTGLPKATVSHIINKLLDYEIVFKKFPAHKKPARNQEGVHYFIKDFYLNFYFQILAPLSNRIKTNMRGLIFPAETGLSGRGYYIPNFSGGAFELLIRYILEQRQNLTKPFFKKLMLKDENYQVLDYWDATTQIDLVVEHPRDRLSRIIECKWGPCQTAWIDEIISKNYNPPRFFSKKYFLVLGEEPTQAFLDLARQRDVVVVTIADFFDV